MKKADLIQADVEWINENAAKPAPAAAAGPIDDLSELIAKTEAELLGCKNFGVTSLNEIKERLVGYGLSLRKLE